MNITAISSPAAAAAPMAAPVASGPTFAQHIGTAFLTAVPATIPAIPALSLTLRGAAVAPAAVVEPMVEPMVEAPVEPMVEAPVEPMVEPMVGAPVAAAATLTPLPLPPIEDAGSSVTKPTTLGETPVANADTAAQPISTQGRAAKAPMGEQPPGQAIVVPQAILRVAGPPLAQTNRSAIADAGTANPDVEGNLVGEGENGEVALEQGVERDLPLVARSVTGGAEMPTASVPIAATAGSITGPVTQDAPQPKANAAPSAMAVAHITSAERPTGTPMAERSALEAAGVARAEPLPVQSATPSTLIAAQPAPSFAARLAEAYPTAATAPAPPPEVPVEARMGRIGQDMGVEIARHLAAGREELTVRLNPADMGRIEVRMGFDEGGTIRAVVVAESPAALDLLRRDASDLTRALSDAGIRSDAQSFRFDARGGDAGQSGQRSPHDGRRHADGRPMTPLDGDPDIPLYRPLRTSGRIDLLA